MSYKLVLFLILMHVCAVTCCGGFFGSMFSCCFRGESLCEKKKKTCMEHCEARYPNRVNEPQRVRCYYACLRFLKNVRSEKELQEKLIKYPLDKWVHPFGE